MIDQAGGRVTPAAIYGDNPYDPEPYGAGVPATRRERSGVVR
jgi:hypothetical protein